MKKEEIKDCKYILIKDSKSVAIVIEHPSEIVCSDGSHEMIKFAIYGSESLENRTYYVHYEHADVVEKNDYRDFVEKKLVAEARDRGFKKGVKHRGASNVTEVTAKEGKMYYKLDQDELVMDNFVIYRNGTWAEIIGDEVEEKAKESDNEFVKGNTLIADFMGYHYKCTSESLDYHHIQRMKEDGTPYRDEGTLNKFIDVYDLWNPHKDWNDLMGVIDKIESLGYSSAIYGKKRGQSFDAWFYDQDGGAIASAEGKTRMVALYGVIIEFMEWYNENEKN